MVAAARSCHLTRLTDVGVLEWAKLRLVTTLIIGQGSFEAPDLRAGFQILPADAGRLGRRATGRPGALQLTLRAYNAVLPTVASIEKVTLIILASLYLFVAHLLLVTLFVNARRIERGRLFCRSRKTGRIHMKQSIIRLNGGWERLS
jgi:hypothetical protein